MSSVISRQVEGLPEARSLLQRGFVSAAGCIGRGVLENHLRELCAQHGLPATRRPPLRLRIHWLREGGVLGKRTVAELRQLIKIGNRCCHGLPVGYMAVAELLDRVRLLLTTHPINESECDKWDSYCEQDAAKGDGDCCHE